MINVALMNTGCPRPVVRDTALQLLQLLDKRFFGAVGLLAEGDLGKCSLSHFLFYLSGREMRASSNFATTVLITVTSVCLNCWTNAVETDVENTEYLKEILYLCTFTCCCSSLLIRYKYITSQ